MQKRARTFFGRLAADRSGQSLGEIVIGLAIGAVLIAAAAFAIVSMMKANSTTQKDRVAVAFSQALMGQVRAFASSDWFNVDNLPRGATSTYFIVASGTAYVAAEGKEGMLDGDVLPGLAAQWKFDEASGTVAYDNAGGGHAAVLENGPARETFLCKFGNCLRFASSSAQYAEVAGMPDMQDAPFTLAAWVNLRSRGGCTAPIVEKYANPGVGNYRFFADENGKLVFRLKSVDQERSLAGSSTLPLFDWVHVAATYDGTSTARLYVDGEQDASIGAMTGGHAADPAPFRIGRSLEGCYLDGMLDDVRVYGRELSAAEVKKLRGAAHYERWFSLENVCRSDDASSTIAGVAPCAPGSSEDPSALKATAITEWDVPTGFQRSPIADYLTRWKNGVFLQSDWSGGPEPDASTTAPTNVFATSSNVLFGSGTIRITDID